MIFDVDLLIERTKSAQGLKSDRDLDRFLGHKGQAVSQWRTRRTIPSDENLIKMCEAASYSPEQITQELVKLAIHRTASTEQVQANEQWRKLLEGLTGSLKILPAALIAGLMLLTLHGKPADAATSTSVAILSANALYYGKLFISFCHFLSLYFEKLLSKVSLAPALLSKRPIVSI